MMLKLWLVWRYIKSGRGFLSLHIVLAIFAMSLGVACLIVAMAIVSGYESTLRNALVDSFGHLIVVRRGEPIKDPAELQKTMTADHKEVQGGTPFLLLEAIAAKSGKLQGVLIEGVDPSTSETVVNLKKHIIEGQLAIDHDQSGVIRVAVGKVLRDRLKASIGDEIRLVVPIAEKFGGDKFRPRTMKVKIAGFLDMGRHDFDERYVVMNLGELQKFSRLGGAATGLRLRLDSYLNAEKVGEAIQLKLGHDYVTRTWYDSNRNLFEAIEYEKPVIFLIVCLIVVAAGFSVSGALYVSVLRRFRDISVLKTIGAESSLIRSIFTIQGLIVGGLGSLFGLGLGAAACFGLTELQNIFQLFPGEVYRIDKVALELRAFDIGSIFLVSMLVCFLSGLAPSARGARLSTVEGLRYE